MALPALREPFIQAVLPEEVRQRVRSAPLRLNSAGYDPWGLNPVVAETVLACVRWMYTSYFRVKTEGISNVPAGRVLLVSNHGCQLPLDGLLIALAMVLEANPPRIVRGMVERWVPTIPFISSLFSQCGQVVGEPRNCVDLLEREEAVLVFPEGLRGTGKSIFKRYQLQRFGTGFARLALQTRAPIVPVATIGLEEAYPALAHLRWLPKFLNIPYVPITPFFPWLGPLGMVPLPRRVSIRFGEPLRLEGDPDAPDRVIQKQVDLVREAIEREIALGRPHA